MITSLFEFGQKVHDSLKDMYNYVCWHIACHARATFFNQISVYIIHTIYIHVPTYIENDLTYFLAISYASISNKIL